MPLYSEEIQDIMGCIPGRILKIGLTIIFTIVLLVLIGSYFFKYPEIISCPITLTTINPPQELYARSTGMITQLAANEHDTVKAGRLIAILRNTADYKDTKVLESNLQAWEQVVIWDSIVQYQKLHSNLKLGELQTGYSQLIKAWNNFHHYLTQKHLPLKIALQTTQIQKDKKAYGELVHRLQLEKQDFLLSEKQFKRDSSFYHRFRDAMSLSDYEKITQVYLQKKTVYLNSYASLLETENNILKEEEQLIDLNIQYEKELNSHRQELDESYQLLYENYRQWKEKYLLVSDISGVVTLTGYWSEQQTVNAGERIATIVPLEHTQIIGRAYIGMTGIGKVEKGQKVNIKLDGFPYMQYGLLRGVINHISLVPEKEKGYMAEINLTDGMESSYQESLKFIQQIEGTAEIITADRRLLTKLIAPFKSKINE